MKRKSHLVVRVIPESNLHTTSSFDFVELCGSDLAASQDVVASETRESERDRKFASKTFNSLSKSLVALANGRSLHRQQSTTEACPLLSLVPLQAKVVFCVNLHANSVSKDLRHNITALKFTSKIREAILKK